MQSVLNVRMDSALKVRGDKVLADSGMSVSEAVRALWSVLAETHEVPELLRKSSAGEAKKKAKLKALERLSAIGKAASSERSGRLSNADAGKPADYLAEEKAMMDAVYDDMWKEYEELR